MMHRVAFRFSRKSLFIYEKRETVLEYLFEYLQNETALNFTLST